MGLDELRARLDRLLAGTDHRARAAGLRDVLVDLKAALGEQRDALKAAEAGLVSERQQLADAERRGRLAAEISDAETAEIAERYAGKHRERVAILERKIAVISDEIAFTEREYEALSAQFKAARLGADVPPPADPAAAELDRDFDLLKSRQDREAREAAVQAQLEHLKKKLGKQP